MLLAGLACSGPGPRGPEPPIVGDALTGSAVVSSDSIPPGQEVVRLLAPFENGSVAPLHITKLRAVPGDGVPQAVQVVQVSIVDSREIAPGVYVTFPPVIRSGGRCLRALIRAPRGLLVEPGDRPLILLWLRAVAEGEGVIDGFRVTYEQGGTLYQQEIEEPGTVLAVDPAAKPFKPSRDERACASQTRFLPGAVSY